LWLVDELYIGGALTWIEKYDCRDPTFYLDWLAIFAIGYPIALGPYYLFPVF